MYTKDTAKQDASDRAQADAKAYLEKIIDIFTRIQVLRGEDDDSQLADSDALEERAREMPLSVDVRDGRSTSNEYQILLSTGGPACRVWGTLEDGRPTSAEIQWQGWGTPWTRLDVPDSEDEARAMEWFVNLFYFGE